MEIQIWDFYKRSRTPTSLLNIQISIILSNIQEHRLEYQFTTSLKLKVSSCIHSLVLKPHHSSKTSPEPSHETPNSMDQEIPGDYSHQEQIRNDVEEHFEQLPTYQEVETPKEYDWLSSLPSYSEVTVNASRPTITTAEYQRHYQMRRVQQQQQQQAVAHLSPRTVPWAEPQPQGPANGHQAQITMPWSGLYASATSTICPHYRGQPLANHRDLLDVAAASRPVRHLMPGSLWEAQYTLDKMGPITPSWSEYNTKVWLTCSLMKHHENNMSHTEAANLADKIIDKLYYCLWTVDTRRLVGMLGMKNAGFARPVITGLQQSMPVSAREERRF